MQLEAEARLGPQRAGIGPAAAPADDAAFPLQAVQGTSHRRAGNPMPDAELGLARQSGIRRDGAVLQGGQQQLVESVVTCHSLVEAPPRMPRRGGTALLRAA